MELFRRKSEEIVKGFFVDLLFLLFFLFGEAQYLIFWCFFDELDLGIVSIGDVLFMESLAIEDSIDVFQHSLQILVGHQLSFVF